MATYKRRRSALYTRPSKRRKMYKKTRRVFKRKVRRVKRRLGRSAYGFPAVKYVTMKYMAQFSFTMQSYTNVLSSPAPGIRMNSPYDPDSASTGTFNMVSAGYRLHSVLYKRYTVVGSKAVFTLRPVNNIQLSSGTVGYVLPLKWGVKLDNDNSLVGYGVLNWPAICSDPNTYSKTYHPMLPGIGNGEMRSRIVVKYSPRKFFGRGANEDELGANFGSNPTKQCYAVPWVQVLNCTDTVSQPNTMSLEVVVYYKVKCSEMNDVVDLSAADALIES